MAWKKLSNAQRTYWVNLDQVAYLQRLNTERTRIAFSAATDDARVTISVDQTPEEILVGEDFS